MKLCVLAISILLLSSCGFIKREIKAAVDLPGPLVQSEPRPAMPKLPPNATDADVIKGIDSQITFGDRQTDRLRVVCESIKKDKKKCK